MTEDDTFNALKRIPFRDLEPIIESLTQEEFDSLVSDNSKKELFLNKLGWTSKAFDRECKKKYE